MTHHVMLPSIDRDLRCLVAICTLWPSARTADTANSTSPGPTLAGYSSVSLLLLRCVRILYLSSLTLDGLVVAEMPEDELVEKYRRVSDPQDVSEQWDSVYRLTEDGCIHGRTCRVGAGVYSCNAADRFWV